MSTRAREVIGNVAERGWENYRSICEQLLATSHQLWTQAESLITAVADACQDDCMELLVEGNRLLAACDRLVESEEEILVLNDLSVQSYVSAHEQRDLVWQKYFRDKSWILIYCLLILELTNTSLNLPSLILSVSTSNLLVAASLHPP